jgi:hypothetical protein
MMRPSHTCIADLLMVRRDLIQGAAVTQPEGRGMYVMVPVPASRIGCLAGLGWVSVGRDVRVGREVCCGCILLS